jgi:DNA-binding MarR family transcriptional regulator
MIYYLEIIDLETFVSTSSTDAVDALHVWNLFQQTYLLAFRHLETLTNREGLSHSQAAALGVLANADRPLPLSHLARYLTQEAQSTTELADRLERRGLVRRTRDARDRRLVLLELTAEGRDVYERIQPALVEGGEHLFQGLNARDRARLAALLRPVRDRAADLLGLDDRRRELFAVSPTVTPTTNGKHG